MKVLVQRVSRARVTVGSEVTGEIGRGLLIFVGVEPNDGERTAAWYAEKVQGLRIFKDETGHMNRSLAEVQGSALVVSQFTLAGSTRRGRRPSFEGAAPMELGEKLYLHFVASLASLGVPVKTGRFRADMQVELVNDGPVTFLLDPPGEAG